MKLPVGKISGLQLDTLFNEVIKYHIDIYFKTISEFEHTNLYSNWRTIIRTIDEIINIPLELDNEDEIMKFLHLKFDFIANQNFDEFKDVLEILNRQFENNVSARFQQIAMMSYAIDATYQKQGIYNKQGSNLNLSSTADSIAYFQSRRAYYVTTLSLIPHIAKYAIV